MKNERWESWDYEKTSTTRTYFLCIMTAFRNLIMNLRIKELVKKSRSCLTLVAQRSFVISYAVQTLKICASRRNFIKMKLVAVDSNLKWSMMGVYIWVKIKSKTWQPSSINKIRRSVPSTPFLFHIYRKKLITSTMFY